MELGNFSVSLTVKDIEMSRAFYEHLGFNKIHGDTSQGWLIMKSKDCVIGLFHGVFDKNTLTFNPGWDSSGNKLERFTDVREIQNRLKAAGVKMIAEVDETTVGPGNCATVDPDGNPILIDQHV